MNKNEIPDFLNDLFSASNSSYRAKDDRKFGIASQKKAYEERLDEMWKIYMVNPQQIIEYNKQLTYIKECGCSVLRNGDGKHKITFK